MRRTEGKRLISGRRMCRWTLSAAERGRLLEDQLPPELHPPHGRAGGQGRDLPEGRRAEAHVRVREVRPVEQVEHLDAELEAPLAADRDVLHEGQVRLLV